MTQFFAIRVIAVVVSVLTLAFLALGRTANADIFLPADVVFAIVLIGAALVPEQRLATLGLLVGFAYTAGVFSISVTIAAVRGPFNIATTVGLLVVVVCVLLLGYRWYTEARD